MSYTELCYYNGSDEAPRLDVTRTVKDTLRCEACTDPDAKTEIPRGDQLVIWRLRERFSSRASEHRDVVAHLAKRSMQQPRALEITY